MNEARQPADAPTVSVVLATSSAKAVRRTLDTYRQQTVAGRTEVVVVAPPGELGQVAAQGAPDLACLTGVAAEEPFHLATARAAGVLAARAPWVFVGETHSFPTPRMLEHLLAAAGSPIAGAAPLGLIPAIDNANPSGATSWASLLVDYGAWGPGQPAGAAMLPPIYNVLFDRAAVVAKGDRLVDALSPHDETIFPLTGDESRRTRFVHRALIDHLNVDRLRDLAGTKRWLGLAIGRHRAERWGWPRRLAYAAASPLIAVVLLRRYAASQRVVARERALPRGLWSRLALSAIARAAGEAQGYLGLAPSWVEERLQNLEIHKADFIASWDE